MWANDAHAFIIIIIIIDIIITFVFFLLVDLYIYCIDYIITIDHDYD